MPRRFDVETLEGAKRSFNELGRYIFETSCFGIRCSFCGKTKYIEGRYLLRILEKPSFKCSDCVAKERKERRKPATNQNLAYDKTASTETKKQLQSETNCEKIDFIIPYVFNAKYSFSVAVTKYDHTEIEYVIKSIRKFCTWSNRIFVVGPVESPVFPESIRDEIIYVHCPDPYRHIKDANIINAVLHVIKTVDDLSETFIMASDDQVVTKPSLITDFWPRVERDYTRRLYVYKREIDLIPNGRPRKIWRTAMYHTLQKFKKRAYLYEPHIWTRFNKTKFLEMCKKYDIAHDDGVVIFTLYNNFTKQERRMVSDHMYFGDRISRQEVLNKLKKIPRHLAWTNTAFNLKEFRAYLNKKFLS